LSDTGTTDRFCNVCPFQTKYIYYIGSRTFYNKHPNIRNADGFNKYFLMDKLPTDIQMAKIEFLKDNNSLRSHAFTLGNGIYLTFDNDMREMD
jgi:hypothetical protein